MVSKTGRAEIATDPMGVEISDVFVMLKPPEEWQTAHTREGLIEKLDAARRELTDAEAALRAIVAERRALEASLIAERKDLVTMVRTTTASRDQLRTQIEASALRTYDRLRVRHGGVAVAEVKQRTCQGCRVSMIAAHEQRLRQGEQLITCQSCGRFVFLLN